MLANGGGKVAVGRLAREEAPQGSVNPAAKRGKGQCQSDEGRCERGRVEAWIGSEGCRRSRDSGRQVDRESRARSALTHFRLRPDVWAADGTGSGPWTRQDNGGGARTRVDRRPLRCAMRSSHAAGSGPRVSNAGRRVAEPHRTGRARDVGPGVHHPLPQGGSNEQSR